MLPCDKAALRSGGGGGTRYVRREPFVCVFCCDFRSLTNHKNARLSLILMRQRRAAASERTESTARHGEATTEEQCAARLVSLLSFSPPFYNEKYVLLRHRQ